MMQVLRKPEQFQQKTLNGYILLEGLIIFYLQVEKYSYWHQHK